VVLSKLAIALNGIVTRPQLLPKKNLSGHLQAEAEALKVSKVTVADYLDMITLNRTSITRNQKRWNRKIKPQKKHCTAGEIA
jgi:hypothetical protein